MSDAPDRQQLADRLAFVVGSISRRLRPSAESLTHVGVSALASIARAGAIRPGDLARLEGMAAPGMTRLVADLEQQGLVARESDPDDGRSLLLRITEAGSTAIAVARQQRATGVAELLADSDDAELRALADAVTALEHALLRAPAPQRAVRAG
jgi:DNA-binding MarR family transcriptional regulator